MRSVIVWVSLAFLTTLALVLYPEWSGRDKGTWSTLHEFKFTSSNSTLPFVTLVVVVTSPAAWVDRRQRIRAQFARNLGLITDDSTVVFKFALGSKRTLTENNTLVDAEVEASTHEDILFFDCHDMDDSLNHSENWHLAAGESATTKKVLLSIEWATAHFRFKYFFRLGDDSYFRVDRFMTLLSNNTFPERKAVVGRMESGYVFDMQQTYAQGAGYAVTYDACVFIAANTRFLLDTAPEDCVVARWLFAIGVNFVHSPLWRDMGGGESCQPDMILAHKLPPPFWANISADGNVVC